MSAALALHEENSQVTRIRRPRGRKRRASRAPATLVTVESVTDARELGVVDQVRVACRARHRLAGAVGLAVGGVIPVFTYLVAHRATSAWSLPALLALGGLIFSAPTVFDWARAALASTWKALGFVVLLEGVMVTAHTLDLAWIGYVALAYLVLINAVATGCRLALSAK
jgi:hypothetical protein